MWWCICLLLSRLFWYSRKKKTRWPWIAHPSHFPYKWILQKKKKTLAICISLSIWWCIWLLLLSWLFWYSGKKKKKYNKPYNKPMYLSNEYEKTLCVLYMVENIVVTNISYFCPNFFKLLLPQGHSNSGFCDRVKRINTSVLLQLQWILSPENTYIETKGLTRDMLSPSDLDLGPTWTNVLNGTLLMKENNCANLYWHPPKILGVMVRTKIWPSNATLILPEQMFKWHF